MDVYGSDTAQNLSFLYRSEDDGQTWSYVCDLHPLFWGNLFVNRGRLYILGVSTEFGDMVIGASDDDGFTWTAPVHLFCGSSTVGAGWEQAAMPVLRRNGRLHFSVEYGRLPDVSISVLSVHEDADLLDPASWSATEPLPFDRRWPGTPEGDPRMYVEGNLLTDRNGNMLDLLRVNLHGCSPDHGKMCVLSVDDNHPESPCSFAQWIDMPSGSNSKTHILFDEVSGRYIAIGNLSISASRQRNILALMSSMDAYHWQTDHILIDYRNAPRELVGFQYPSFLIEGGDLLLQLRTAFNGARNYHDANYSTFHRIRNFRQYLKKDSL